MVKLNARAVKQLVNNGLKDYLIQIGAEKRSFDALVNRIIAYAADNRVTYIIPKQGHHDVVVWGNNLVKIIDGEMISGDWGSPLNGQLYVVGREGYVKIKSGKSHFRDFRQLYQAGIDSIQLFVRPYADFVHVLNVGKKGGMIVAPQVKEINTFALPNI